MPRMAAQDRRHKPIGPWKEVNYGIPYDSIPRLIMCWMCTEAEGVCPYQFVGSSNRLRLLVSRKGKARSHALWERAENVRPLNVGDYAARRTGNS